MSQQIDLETERTYLRKLTVQDAQNFYDLNSDPEVLKFTGDKPFATLEEAKTYLSNYDQYEKYGVGRLAVIDKTRHEFIGWCGLKYSPEKDEYDIGFRFMREHWNKGFATENAARCLEHGFMDLNIQRIVGRAMKENTASIKVLDKLGMKFKNSFEVGGREWLIFERTK